AEEEIRPVLRPPEALLSASLGSFPLFFSVLSL
ncbi:hypothetical protein AK812_SmicGene48470, partial [Symbiodinium microadriaticum]